MRSQGFHFRRQAPFHGFYLDFACFARRFVVEVDGSQHGDEVQARHDAMRDAILRREGFRTLRVWNSDVDTNLDGVMVMIQQALGLDFDNAHHPFFRTAPDIPTRSLRDLPPQEGREQGGGEF